MTVGTAATEAQGPSLDDFAAMLDESFGGAGGKIEGTVVKGTIIAIDGEEAIVDVGLKSEGRVALKEFASPGQAPEVKVGDTVEVYVERFENKTGEAVLSRDKARREESWNRLENAFNQQDKVDGSIYGRVKGGFAVDLGGAVAFLPGSQVDIRPVRDVTPLVNKQEPFLILKMDRRRGNIVVSRRAVLEESRKEQREELLSTLSEGQIIDGVVNTAGTRSVWLGRWVYRNIDQKVVDGVVNGSGLASRGLGEELRHTQTGKVQQYAAILFAGATILAGLFILFTS